MNTALPIATETALERATSPLGGGAIVTHPLVQPLTPHARFALQALLQPGPPLVPLLE